LLEEPPMSQHRFLSEAWIEAARALRDAERPRLEVPTTTMVKMNLVVEDVPFGEGRLLAHLDTSTGVLELDLGHLDEADVRVTLGYGTAQAILIEGDRQVAMEAFMAGEIRVEGNLGVLFEAFSGHQGDGGLIAAELRAITAPLGDEEAPAR
jgi:hypothetical protein